MRILSAEAAIGLRHRTREQDDERTKELPDVAKLSVNPGERSEFLLGTEPIWADLQSGRAILRAADEDIWKYASSRLSEAVPGLVVLTGTAGSGKSTSLMRLCLRFVAQGDRVGWVNRDSDISIREVRRDMRMRGAPRILALDDADIFGTELPVLIRDLVKSNEQLLILCAIRAGKLDRVLTDALLTDVPKSEFGMPPLEDHEIGALLDVLDRENRLGILKGKSRGEQEAAFRENAGRQLLVAMIQATSGKRFEDKCVQELTDLTDSGAKAYAMIAVATSFRYGLAKDEILLATGVSRTRC